MKLEKIRFFNKNRRTSIKIVNLLDKYRFLDNKELFFENLLEDLDRDKEKGLIAGFLDKSSLINQLKDHIFDRKIVKIVKKKYQEVKNEEIKNLIKSTLGKTKHFINSKRIVIYLFPTSSEFIIKKMRGCSGFVPWKNIIHIYFYPKKNWKTNLRGTLLHELAHCIQPYYSYKMTLFEHLIAEGLAEHFQMKFTKKRNPWTYSISKIEAIRIFKNTLDKLNKSMEKDYFLHMNLFFGNKNYPLWAGYTIGFYLASDLLKDKKKIDWGKILKSHPSNFRNDLKSWFN